MSGDDFLLGAEWISACPGMDVVIGSIDDAVKVLTEKMAPLIAEGDRIEAHATFELYRLGLLDVVPGRSTDQAAEWVALAEIASTNWDAAERCLRERSGNVAISLSTYMRRPR